MLVMVRSFIFKNSFYFLFGIFILFPQFILAADIVVNSDVSISARVNGINDHNKSGSVLNFPTSISFSGLAYPLSRVYILKDGNIVATTIADSNSHFSVSVFGLNTNVYTFSIYGQDSSGRKSSFFSFPIYIKDGTTVHIGNIFLSPTIDVNKTVTRKGDNLMIFGQSLPEKEVVISVFFGQIYIYRVISNKLGLYFYNLDTSVLSIGKYQTKAKTVLENKNSLDSLPITFSVGTQDVLNDNTNCLALKGDLNCDNHVNLTDFSIMTYWHHKINPPKKIDLNNDGIISLIDFSIMAFNWTG